MPLKFEQERAGVGFELRLSIGRQHQIIEQFGIEKAGIELAYIPEGAAWLSRESWFSSPIPIRSPLVLFEIGRWRHDGDTVDGLPIEATKRLKITAQQMSCPDTDCRPQNGTVVLWEFCQDRQLALWWQDRHDLDGAAQPF